MGVGFFDNEQLRRELGWTSQEEKPTRPNNVNINKSSAAARYSGYEGDPSSSATDGRPEVLGVAAAAGLPPSFFPLVEDSERARRQRSGWWLWESQARPPLGRGSAVRGSKAEAAGNGISRQMADAPTPAPTVVRQEGGGRNNSSDSSPEQQSGGNNRSADSVDGEESEAVATSRETLLLTISIVVGCGVVTLIVLCIVRKVRGRVRGDDGWICFFSSSCFRADGGVVWCGVM